jgi:putative methyltransferase (TIGR04325 family)
MAISDSPPELVRGLIKRIAPIQAVRAHKYERCFRRGYGLFRGIFSDFEDARRSAPQDRRLGMDWPEYARHHTDRVEHIEAYDYPCLFWLRRILDTNTRVLDYGGNVGVHYHAYARYLEYPAGLEWLVCELPTMVTLGEHIARQRNATNLSFTTNFRQAEGSDVLIASGVLQYIQEPLAERLASLRARPRHLLLNKLPLYDGEPFVTLQNGGPVFAPQHVFKRGEFLSGLRTLGYELIDSWDVPGLSCHVPFHPERAVPMYSGLYLRLGK